MHAVPKSQNSSNISDLNQVGFWRLSFFLLLSFTWSVNSIAGSLAYITNQGSNTVSVLDVENKKVTHSIEVGKAPVGVAIASKQQRVYISNANSQSVSIINRRTQQVTQEIPVKIQAVGITLSRDEKTLYVADWGGAQVIAIDTANPEKQKAFKAGKTPSGMVVSADNKKLFIANRDSDDVTVIDTRTLQTIAQGESWHPSICTDIKPGWQNRICSECGQQHLDSVG